MRLTQLLSEAKVSSGHWNGKHIHVEGCAGHITFSELGQRVSDLYRTQIAPMSNRLEEYNRSQEISIPRIPVKGGMWLVALTAPVWLPFSLVAQTANQAVTPLPTLTNQEKANIPNTIEWRKAVDKKTSKLFGESNNLTERVQTWWSEQNWKYSTSQQDLKNFKTLAEYTTKKDLLLGQYGPKDAKTALTALSEAAARYSEMRRCGIIQ